MQRQEIEARLQPICREVFEKPELELNDELDATRVDTWTSLSFMQLLTRTEEEFGFRFKMTELLKIRNIGSLINAISSHL
jgi:acyl carrier protein